MKILWKPSPLASCLHAAMQTEAVQPLLRKLCEQGQTLRSAQPLLKQPATWLASVGCARSWNEWSVRFSSDDSIVSLLESSDDSIVSLLQELQTQCLKHHPALADDLSPRVRPMREQWEARGPGFIRALESVLDASLPKQFVVHLVAPVLGGWGAFLVRDTPSEGVYGEAFIEAMLYHPRPDIPEPVRIGWLAAQSAIAQKHFALRTKGSRERWEATKMETQRWALAAIPAVIEAAQFVDWLGDVDWPDLLDHLCCLWPDGSAVRELDSGSLAEQLKQWWAAPQRWERGLEIVS